MNKKIALILGISLLLIITVLAIWLSTAQKDKYTIVEEKVSLSDRVSVNFSKHNELFTPAQESNIQATLLTMTTKEVSENSQYTGNIRESSIKRASEHEVSIIIDSPELQTSYLVSRFQNPEDNLDIVNVVCVDESEKIYEQDYCLVE